MARLPQTPSLPEQSPRPRPVPVPGRRIGIHTSVAGGVSRAAERAHRLGCNTFQIFSSSPRQWKPSPVDPAEARRFARLREKHDLYPLVIHDNYLINLASSDPVIRRKSLEAFRGELERALALGADYLVTHPGSAGNGDRAQALARFIAGLEEAARGMKLGRLRVLIENTAGGGGSLGCDFAEMKAILERTGTVAVGCCLDTAHCYQAGFDVSSARGLADTLARVEATIGLDRVPVIHTNDSRTRLGSRADRHEHIGLGGIGLEGFRRILNHPRLRDKAFILETPIEQQGDDLRNLETVRGLVRARRNRATKHSNVRASVQPAGNRAQVAERI